MFSTVLNTPLVYNKWVSLTSKEALERLEKTRNYCESLFISLDIIKFSKSDNFLKKKIIFLITLSDVSGDAQAKSHASQFSQGLIGSTNVN